MKIAFCHPPFWFCSIVDCETQIYADYYINLYAQNPTDFARQREFAYDKFSVWVENANSNAGKDVLKALLPNSLWDKFGG